MAGMHELMTKTGKAAGVLGSVGTARAAFKPGTKVAGKPVVASVTARLQLDKSVVTSVLGKKGMSYADAIKAMQEAKEKLDWITGAIEVLNARSVKLDPESLAYENLMEEHQNLLDNKKDFQREFMQALMLVVLYEMGIIR